MNKFCMSDLIFYILANHESSKMRITLAYNLKTQDSEKQAELFLPQDVARLCKSLQRLKHSVTPVEVSGKVDQIIEKIMLSEPEFIFNVAEGIEGESREAFYPLIYENLNIPFTGSGAFLLFLGLDKHATKAILHAHGINTPKGVFVSKEKKFVPKDLKYPLIIKPNSEGSSMGISQKSVVENRLECEKTINELLRKYPCGLLVEEYIAGREISVPMLEAYPGQILEIVEHDIDVKKMKVKYNIYDYSSKMIENNPDVKTICPAKITKDEYEKIIDMSKKIFSILDCKDFGRIDIRLSEDKIPYFIEINPLPSLLPDASVAEAAKVKGINYTKMIDMILKSAVNRYQKKLVKTTIENKEKLNQTKKRLTFREEGLSLGYFKPGKLNAITDVKGVKVGHLTYIHDDKGIPDITEGTRIRTGITSIIPIEDNIFETPIAAGGFVLNGRGEMAGITQILEWEWLESPILLCNTLSVGRVHDGIITYMLEQYPKISKEKDVIIPVIGEADDSFLNDAYIRTITTADVKNVIKNSKSGPVAQGSVGAGTGMTTFDFAGGIGTSSRVLDKEHGGFTIGALVLSNFGEMKNLTIEGMVVGKEFQNMVSAKRKDYLNSAGSVIVVVATDAPLLSSQLTRISKRAALGLGRVGSFADTTSGEIIISFSTGNQLKRERLHKSNHLNIKFVNDNIVNFLYQAVIESVEEAVINAIFCSSGMKGRDGNYSPAIPHKRVIALLKQGIK